MKENKTFVIIHPTIVGFTQNVKCARIANVEGLIHLINSQDEIIGILPFDWAVYEMQF